MQKIVAREREIKILEAVWNSKEAEFVAIYGRRRVGKTHLIREFFSNKGLYCEVIGLKDGSIADQLHIFGKALAKTFYPELPLISLSNWMEAFEILTKSIERIPQSKKIALFLDELPWMAGKRSKFLQALDHYWNSRWSRCRNLKLIVCGSAASWMLNHLVNAKGGLHNRLTRTILLEPMTLGEVKQYLKSLGAHFVDRQILDLYMVTGGIPHYLKQVDFSQSIPQNIDQLCFSKDGVLHNEFDRLFYSLFNSAEEHLKVIRVIAQNRGGIKREELLKKLGIHSGGSLNRRLGELQSAGSLRRGRVEQLLPPRLSAGASHS